VLDGPAHPPAHHPARRIDAVVVPAARPATSLEPAVRTAIDRGCPLVVFASHRCHPADVGRVASELGLAQDRLIVIDMGPRAEPLLPTFSADVFFRKNWVPDELSTAATGCQRSNAPRNTSVKRNVALEFAWLQHWSTVLFLDDDVTPPTREQLDDCLAVFDADEVAISKGLARQPVVVAFRHREFPDNSIVRHAGRLAGLDQEVRTGAGAFLISLRLPPPHFPHIYNEDWLFFWDCASGGRGGVVDGGELHQEAYDPFADPHAAHWQEYGDVVAEGMREMGYAGQRSEELFASGDWCIAVSRRRELIEAYRQRLLAVRDGTVGSEAERDRAAKALPCLDEALSTLAGNEDWAEEIPRYLTLWREDAQVWSTHLDLLRDPAEQPPDVDTALARLGLARYPVAAETVSPPRLELAEAAPVRDARPLG